MGPTCPALPWRGSGDTRPARAHPSRTWDMWTPRTGGMVRHPTRVRATAEADGELHLRGLPIRRGEEAEAIMLTEGTADEALLAVLEHDPGWAWLHDPAEDIYSVAP